MRRSHQIREPAEVEHAFEDRDRHRRLRGARPDKRDERNEQDGVPRLPLLDEEEQHEDENDVPTPAGAGPKNP
jgi:hypothetical protein